MSEVPGGVAYGTISVPEVACTLCEVPLMGEAVPIFGPSIAFIGDRDGRAVCLPCVAKAVIDQAAGGAE